MIEFLYFDIDGRPEHRATMTVSTELIAVFEPTGDTDHCVLTLTSGRALVVDVSYTAFRRLVLHARSGFASAIGADQ